MKKTLLLFVLMASVCSTVRSQWMSVKPAGMVNIQEAAFIDDNTAYLLSADTLFAMYKTENGGGNWATLARPDWTSPDPVYANGICFPDEQNGFIYANWLVNGGVFAGGTESFVLFRTNDGGQHWQTLFPDMPAQGFQVISSIHFFNALQGMMTVVTGLGHDLVKTTDDGGETWQTRDTIIYWHSAQHLQSDGTGVYLRYSHDFSTHSSNNYLYEIDDFGKTWTLIGDPLNDPDWTSHRIGLWFNNLLYLENDRVFRYRTDAQGIGPHDDLWFIDYSEDGGANWQNDFLTLVGEQVDRIEIKGNSIWAKSWTNLYRRNLLSTHVDSPVLSKDEPRLSPNPATAESALERLPADARTWTLFDVAGRKVQSLDLRRSTRPVISVTNLQPGIYFWEISSKHKTYSGRLIVQH